MFTSTVQCLLRLDKVHDIVVKKPPVGKSAWLLLFPCIFTPRPGEDRESADAQQRGRW